MNFDAQYWQNRYLNNETGWDVKEITKPLKDYVDQIKNNLLNQVWLNFYKRTA